MRWPWERLLEEQFEHSGSKALLVAAPLFLLSLFTFLVRTADSSGEFRIDQSGVLERLHAELRADLAALHPDPDLEIAIEVETAEDDAVVAGMELREVRETVDRGDTFGGLLRRLGIDSGEVTRWTAAAKEYASLAELHPGNEFTFLLPSGTPRLAGLTYELTIDSTLVMREDGDDIVARVERLPRMVDVLAVGGEVRSTLYGAAIDAGVPEDVISEFVDVLGWDVDFSSELQRGDAFRIAYEEEHTTTGRRIGGRLLAAELQTGGKSLQAFRFHVEDDGGKFYTPDGRPYGRAFLRYPVEFARISSQFSTRRFHPILRIHRPHYGVDFAAAIGTPVRSIGPGTVVSAGWKGGNGRYVKIRHGGGIESSYSHLHSIARGVRSGVRIDMGQVIGQVGATGLATGPHLHFAMWKNGSYVNPTKVDLPRQPPLEGNLRRAFEHERDGFREHLAKVEIEGKPMVTVLARSRVAGG